MRNTKKTPVIPVLIVCAVLILLAVFVAATQMEKLEAYREQLLGGNPEASEEAEEEEEVTDPMPEAAEDAREEEPQEEENVEEEEAEEEAPSRPETELITWNESWDYAEYSIIHTDQATLYHAENWNGIIVAVNPGHGTSGGNSVRTKCHPDGSAKVTGGSTAKGETTAAAVSGGATMLDGTSEAVVNLALARIVKDKLLNAGYDVLMLRENDDTQLDNIARTVLANENADCHIALHYDSSENDKGFFYIGVPEVTSYRQMEPVASHYEKHLALGEAILEGAKQAGRKIYGSGRLDIDLTQTSYSKVPSVDVEVGDRGSSWNEDEHEEIAEGILIGLNSFFNI